MPNYLGNEEALVDPLGRVLGSKATRVPNVFAFWDAALAAGNVTLGVADGAMAALRAHRS